MEGAQGDAPGRPRDRGNGTTHMPLHCFKCGAISDQGYLWRAFIVEGEGDDESPTKVVSYCPCALLHGSLGQGAVLRGKNAAAKASGAVAKRERESHRTMNP
jgi:hypothetical protein